MKRNPPLWWSVRPKLTVGSYAAVDEETAARVLMQEWAGVMCALDGHYGEEDAELTMRDPLSGIVVARQDRSQRITDTFDIVTGDRWREHWREGRALRVRLKPWESTITVEELRDELAAVLQRRHERQMEQRRISRAVYRIQQRRGCH